MDNENVNGRKKYVEECKKKNQQFFKQHKFVLTYSRKNSVFNGFKKDKQGRVLLDENGQPLESYVLGERTGGTVLAYKENNKVYIGWSKCKTKEEPFDRQIGINKAISRAETEKLELLEAEKNLDKVPLNLKKEFLQTVERAKRYFKVGV